MIHCQRCARPMPNAPSWLECVPPFICRSCADIADKPEKSKTPADVEANMTIEQVRRGGVRRRG